MKFTHIHFFSRAEDEDDLGEDSDTGSESESESESSSSDDLPEKQPPSTVPPLSDSYSSLFDLSSLEEQLQFKKGLSKYYKGKCQSYTAISEVKCLEDLPKKEKEVPLKRKMKPFNSYREGWGESHNSASLCEGSNISISKKTSSSISSCASSIARTSSGSFVGRRRQPPPIPVNKDQ